MKGKSTGKKRPQVTELIYGFHPIAELLKAKRRRLVTLYTTKPAPKIWSKLSPLLPKGLQLQYVPKETLTKLAGTTDHQGLVGYATPFAYRKKPFDAKKQPFLLMLDGIQDPRNVGAIIRSAYCAGVNGVIITQRKSSPLTATALKSSAGLAEHIEILLAPSAKSAAQDLSSAGYTLYLSDIGGGKNAAMIEYKTPLCLVVGSEGAGISSDIKSKGIVVTLPQRTSDISYNASVAAGILVFMVGTQHKIIFT